jgi:tRNA A-37 threonylcarbamoyl transferase component Bud32
MDQAGGRFPGTVAGQGDGVATAPPGDLRRDLAALGLEDIAELASGGFATVYRARQPAMGRAVAVKVLTAPVTDRLVRSRFQRECQALGVLSDHPAIVTVYDAGFTASGRPYLVMELMTGGSLAEQLERDGPLAWRDVLSIGVHIAGALHSAHHHGVLHRDVKPANILISEYEAAKLGDFGIARLQGAEHTRTGALTGSLAHAAPELLGGSPPSVRSDVYALGSTLFTLLRGETAFLHTTDESIIPALARITTSTIPDLRADGIPAPVCDVVEQLMAKRPEERPESAAEAGHALQSAQRTLDVAVTVLPIPVAPARDAAVPPAGPAPEHGRRRRWFAVGLLAAAVVVGAIVAAAALRPPQQPPPPSDPGGANDDGATLDVTDIADQIAAIRGLEADGLLTAALVPRAAYDELVRAWSTAGREAELQVDQRILAALGLVPDGTDLVAVTQDLAAEQFLAFSDQGQITLRADSAQLSPLQRALVADEAARVLLDRRHDAAARAERLADSDARRAWLALLEGDAVVTAAAWSERHLDDDAQRQRDTELSAQPDRIARGLPAALRAELVFPYVAGEQFVRALFAEGGVAAIEQAYADPPTTTEQLLHPEKYRRGEPPVAVSIPAGAPPGWTELADVGFGEFDLRRLTAELGTRRSAAAAAGWGGGRLRAWQRGDETAVRVSLVFDTKADAGEACTAVRDAHQRRSGAVPTARDVLITPVDAFVVRCAGPKVDLAVAPDQSTATALVQR